MEQATNRIVNHLFHLRPDLMVEGWKESRQLLHLYAQIIGKIRLKLHPKLNHWWHASLSISSVGWTTGLIPYGDDCFEIEVNFIEHMVWIRKSDGRSRHISLRQPTVSAFHDTLFSCLESLGIGVSIIEKPFDESKVKSHIPFNQDDRPITYDANFAFALWQSQLEADIAFQVFRGRFNGKASPVQLFWHSFDLAVTFFSGKSAPKVSAMDPVTAEAYSHEVISFGFWAGDDLVEEPSFYAYAYPEPMELSEEALSPAQAYWNHQERGTMALYRLRDANESINPRQKILEFMESFFNIASRKCDWNKELRHLGDQVFH